MSVRSLTAGVMLAALLTVLSTGGPSRARPEGDSDSEVLLRGTVEARVRGETVPVSGARVFLSGAGGTRAPGTPRMDQVDRTFVPKVVTVRTGTRVLFHNSDTVAHNVRLVRLPDYRRLMNRFTYHGDTTAFTFEEEGVVQVECDVHPTMEAHVVVLTEPFRRTRTDGEGYFEFRLPTGVKREGLSIRAWDEGSGLSEPRTLEAGERRVRMLLEAPSSG